MKTEEKDLRAVELAKDFLEQQKKDLRAVELAKDFLEQQKKAPCAIKGGLEHIVNLCDEAEKQDVRYMLYAIGEIRDNAELLIEVYNRLYNEN